LHYFVYTVAAWTLVYFLVGRRFYDLWKPGLIGMALAALVDYFGTRYNLYLYPIGIIYIGKLPLLHLANVYAATILFLNWLPREWGKRVLYTVYISVLFLTVEAVMFSHGGIVYPNWEIWYSYFLIIGGLFVVAYLADLLRRTTLTK